MQKLPEAPDKKRSDACAKKESSWQKCILHSTNTLGKGMNPIILPPAMVK